MTEKDWVKSFIGDFEKQLRKTNETVRVVDGHRLSYANEVLTYDNNHKPDKQNSIGYETDILVYGQIDDNTWKP